MTESQQLLAEYVATGSEAAFRELVVRYMDLVYSAAIRLVNGDTHLAEDVTQTVFADLAKLARTLSRDVMLGGWLHRHACFVASKTLRGERHRLARERQAVEMNAMEDHSAANLAQVAPILDDAINQLGAEDRTAILLRFFEQHDFRAVGEAMGSNEEASRKRVERALARLELLLKRRGVALSAAALASTLVTQAVSAAPAGLAISISSVALAGAATGGGTAITILKIMSMTKLKIGIISAVVVAGVTIPLVMHQRSQNQLRAANEALQRQAEQTARLAAENEQLSNRVAVAGAPKPAATDPSREVLKLRGEVGRLKQESAAAAARTNAPSALSGLTSDPQTYKLIRDQQKAGLGAIYKELTKRLKLTPEDTGKLGDLLADNIMENLDHITQLLREGASPERMEQVFAGQEAALAEKVQALLGPENFAQFQEYTRNLGSYLTAEQFKGKLSGDDAAKEAKSKQLYQIMQEETQAALASAGLNADFQTVPVLNFRNIVSETEAEKNLKLFDGIYARALARTSSFLSAEEIAKFGEFRTAASNNSRAGLLVNRKMMAPGGR